MKRDSKLCEICVHRNGNYCVKLDSPIDVIIDDIMREEDIKVFQAMDMLVGGTGDIKYEELKPLPKDVDSRCEYFLEHIVLNQED